MLGVGMVLALIILSITHSIEITVLRLVNLDSGVELNAALLSGEDEREHDPIEVLVLSRHKGYASICLQGVYLAGVDELQVVN